MRKEIRNFYGIRTMKHQGLSYGEIGNKIQAIKKRLLGNRKIADKPVLTVKPEVKTKLSLWKIFFKWLRGIVLKLKRKMV